MVGHRARTGYESKERGASPAAGRAPLDMPLASPTARRTAPRAATRNAGAPRGERTRVIAAAGFTVVAWASAFVAIRAVGTDIRPGALGLGRLAIAVLLLGALQLRAAWIAPSRREWLLMAGGGVAWFGIYNVALNAAEHQLDAGTAAMLINIGPVLIAVLAGAFLGERSSRWIFVGALVSLAGVAVIGLAPAGAGPRGATGIVLCLLAVVSYSVAVILQKLALRRLPGLQVIWIACSAGAVACLPFTGQLVADLASAPRASILGVLYLGAVPTALAFTTWAYALARTEAGRLGVTIYLVPPVTVVLSMLLLGEAPAAFQLAGGALCLAGVAVSRRR